MYLKLRALAALLGAVAAATNETANSTTVAYDDWNTYYVYGSKSCSGTPLLFNSQPDDEYERGFESVPQCTTVQRPSKSYRVRDRVKFTQMTTVEIKPTPKYKDMLYFLWFDKDSECKDDNAALPDFSGLKLNICIQQYKEGSD